MNLRKRILKLWETKTNQKRNKILKYSGELIRELQKGNIRVSEQIKNKWITNEWVKKGILLYIEFKKKSLVKGFDNSTWTFDKFNSGLCKERFLRNIRVSEGVVVREGSYIGKNTVLMPSFINVGAYIGKNTMIDTWATVGSCAQVGSNVHISGGSGIGGVLEPIQANPVIIEDNCFIGARSEIVEGIIIKKNTVVSMGVYIGKSTKIFDRQRGVFIKDGIVPENSVVVPGSISYGNYSLYTPIIVKKIDRGTKAKTKINNSLRDKK